MKPLYVRLGALGIAETYVRDLVLPQWWEDEAAENPVTYSQALMIVARHLGLDFRALRDPDAPLVPVIPASCRYKKVAGAPIDSLEVATAISLRVASLVCTAMSQHPLEPVGQALDVRSSILASGAPWVGLEQLLDYCWSVGVPVVPITKWPAKGGRPSALAAHLSGRPVIIICNKKSSAWLLFEIAHELGHIALGHLQDGGAVLDEKFDGQESDAEETAANEYAETLLTGRPHPCYASARWMKAGRLAQEAAVIGRRDRVDPGHVILNYCSSSGPDFYRLANAALKKLAQVPPTSLMRERMMQELDWDEIPEESAEYLVRVTAP